MLQCIPSRISFVSPSINQHLQCLSPCKRLRSRSQATPEILLSELQNTKQQEEHYACSILLRLVFHPLKLVILPSETTSEFGLRIIVHDGLE